MAAATLFCFFFCRFILDSERVARERAPRRPCDELPERAMRRAPEENAQMHSRCACDDFEKREDAPVAAPRGRKRRRTACLRKGAALGQKEDQERAVIKVETARMGGIEMATARAPPAPSRGLAPPTCSRNRLTRAAGSRPGDRRFSTKKRQKPSQRAWATPPPTHHAVPITGGGRHAAPRGACEFQPARAPRPRDAQQRAAR